MDVLAHFKSAIRNLCPKCRVRFFVLLFFLPVKWKMTEYEITKGNAEVLAVAKKNKNKVVLLDFGAVWCGPCRSIAPYLHELTKKYDGELVLCTINVDEEGNQDLSEAYDVKSLPTLVWIQGMNVVKRIEGADKKAIGQVCQDLCT